MSKSDLKKLQREWANKLEASGFTDIETPNGLLKDWDSLRFRKPSLGLIPEQMEAIRDFYTKAEEFYYSFEFPDTTHKEIWRLFSKGHTVDEIVKQLGKAVKFRGLKRSEVHRVIAQYEQFVK
jgi:hypothetical protein